MKIGALYKKLGVTDRVGPAMRCVQVDLMAEQPDASAATTENISEEASDDEIKKPFCIYPVWQCQHG